MWGKCVAACGAHSAGRGFDVKRTTAVFALVFTYVALVACGLAALMGALTPGTLKGLAYRFMYFGPGGMVVVAVLVGLSAVFTAAILGLVFRRGDD